MEQSVFGRMANGQTVHAFKLANTSGLQTQILDYGAIVASLRVPDREGRLADVVLGFDRLEPYIASSPYFGAVVGRYANRIAGGRFVLDDTEYRLAANNGPNHLHGGVLGFDKVRWQSEAFVTDVSEGVVLRHVSPDGDEGYPGNVSAKVVYTLTSDGELAVEFKATTDKATPINLSQHSYFNLAGNGDIGGHLLTLGASRYTPVDANLIPTGEVVSVAGTPFDFREATPIGRHIDADDEQIRRGGGYDHNFVLDRDTAGLSRAARVVEPQSGRVLEVYTTEPGLQFYSGNALDGAAIGRAGEPYARRSGFCLETQHFPDSPNQAHFPSTILRPGQVYRSRTVFRFALA